MRKLFKQYSSRKTPAPDNVSTSTLKHCADELAPVFTDVFNASLNLHPLPVCFKAATIIPLPKKPKPKALNDFRPVALTSVVMTFLERLDLTYLKSVTNFSMDSFQFAYRKNRCTDDAGAFALHFVMQYLESPNRYARIMFVDYIYARIMFVDYIYARIMFVDYSSAFNMVIPQKLVDKLHLLLLDASICYWLLNFLLQRSQVVTINIFS